MSSIVRDIAISVALLLSSEKYPAAINVASVRTDHDVSSLRSLVLFKCRILIAATICCILARVKLSRMYSSDQPYSDEIKSKAEANPPTKLSGSASSFFFLRSSSSSSWLSFGSSEEELSFFPVLVDVVPHSLRSRRKYLQDLLALGCQEAHRT